MTEVSLPEKLPASSMFWFIGSRLIVWLSVMVLAVYLFVNTSISNQEAEFNRQASKAVSRVQEQLVINEAALSGFASILAISGPTAIHEVQDYTRNMREAHAQIYMFEALVGIQPQDQHGFAQRMQLEGLTDYKVYRYVSRKSTTGKPSKPFNVLAETPVMFPVFFIDPYLEEVKGLLGFDMMSAKLMREPLIKALTTGETTASRPYGLREGGKGYLLYKPVRPIAEANGADAPGILVATSLILTDPLLKEAQIAVPGADISLTYGPKRKQAAEQLAAVREEAPLLVLDRLDREFELDKYGQPFTLSMSQDIGLYGAQINQLVILLLLLVLGFMIYLRTSIAKHRSEIQRDEALIRLAQQHDLLEERVAIRTAELQRSSDENKRLANQIIRIQEDQYHHLARELHDEFGQILTAIKISAHIIRESDSNADVITCGSDIYRHSEGLYEKIRNLIQRLRPEALDAFGLKTAIKQCVTEFKFADQGIEVELDIDDSVDSMDETFTIATYRIVQELLNNTAKYAQAKKIIVQLHEEPEGLCVCVIDDGVGFDPDDLDKGYGLNGITERVKTLGGRLQINSTPGEGVNTCVKLPAHFTQ